MTEQASILGLDKAMTAIPQPGFSRVLLPSTALTTDLNGNISTVLGCANARRLNLWVRYSAAAAAGVAELHVLLSAVRGPDGTPDRPAIGDDDWFYPGLFDSSPTEAVITSTLPTGADYTNDPEFRQLTVGPTLIRTKGATDADSEIRVCASIDVTHAIWFYAAAAEVGGGAAGTIAVDYSLSV